VATNGSDASGDGSEARPYATINKANRELPPGGQIRVRPGTYWAGQDVDRTGTPSAYCSLIGDGPRGSVILDGSTTFTGGWSLYQGTIYVRPFSLDSSASLRVVVQGTDQRLHRRVTLDELVHTPASFPPAGFYHDSLGGLLYVRLEGNPPANPNGTPVRAAVQDVGLHVRGAYWYFRNITVNYVNMEAFLLGQYASAPATSSVLDQCDAFCDGAGGVVGNLGSNGLLIQHGSFTDPRIDTWSYESGKFRAEEAARGIFFAGSGCVLRGNLISGTFDGIQTMGSACDPTIGGADSDVHDNFVSHVCDDGLEFDATCGINLAAWHNTITNANHGFSGNPTYVGPTYLLYNDIVNSDQSGVKDGAAHPQTQDPCYPATSLGWVGIFHNTFTSPSPHDAITGGDTYGNKQHLNNILVATQPAGGSGRYVVADDGGDRNTCTFDYDLAYVQSSPPTQPIWRWGMPGSDYFSLGQLANGGPGGIPPALHWEIHGRYGAPMLADTARGDYSLTSSSPAIDHGTLIPGINTPYWTRYQQPLYLGAAPDIGAHEFGTAWVSGVAAAGPSWSVGAAQPNPAFGSVRWGIQLPSDVRVDVRVFDVAGRMIRRLEPLQLTAGTHELRWDGAANDGARPPDGVYFVRTQSAFGTHLARVVLLR
jgi:hypothetical protein